MAPLSHYFKEFQRRFLCFSKRNIGEETGNVKRRKRDKGRGKSKLSDFFYKGERIKHTIRKVLKNSLKKRSEPFS